MEWDEILTEEARYFITRASYEETYKVDKLFNFLKDRIKDTDVIVKLAKNWYTFNSHEQAHIAVHHAGMFQASRFIILMDYLSAKLGKRESE